MKKTKRSTHSLLIIITALLYTFFSLLTTFAQDISDVNFSSDNVVEPGSSLEMPPVAVTQENDLLDQTTDSLLIESEAAVMIDADTGMILYNKNMNSRNYPASITKVMTALLTLEYAQGSYDERIKFSTNAVYGIEPGSSHIAMDVDETLTIDQALYAIMLASANEVSAALAEHIGGSIEGFSDMMNKKAKELGAYDTHFVNPHGLPDDNHYTTAYDMALIMKEALEYDKFIEVISTIQTSIPPTEKQPQSRPLNNSNKLLLNGQYHYDNIVGGKTGYTDIARHTLVSTAQKDDIRLITVTMKGEKNIPYTDSTTLFDYGFSLYNYSKIFNKKDFTTEKAFTPSEDTLRTLTICLKSDIFQNLPEFVDLNQILATPKIDDSLCETAVRGTTVGTLLLSYKGIELCKTDLIISDIIDEQISVEQYKRLNNITDTESMDSTYTAESDSIQEQAKNIGTFFLVIGVIAFLLAIAILSIRFFYTQKQKRYSIRKKYLNSRRY